MSSQNPGPSTIEIRLLGGVEAIDNKGQSLDIGPAKCQVVLAALALSPNTAVAVARIAELVWGSQPPRTAEKTLQSYITRLRKGIGAETIKRTGSAYRLVVQPSAVDVARFQRKLQQGDVEGALQEWVGDPMAGLSCEGMTATIDGLVEQRLGALESSLTDTVESDPVAAIGQLRELASEYPFREGIWALLMVALYRADRQADALAAYQNARENLVEKLGVEPGPRLQELQTQILGQVPDLDLESGTSPTQGAHGRDVRRHATQPSGTVTFGFGEIINSRALRQSRSQQAGLTFEDLDQKLQEVADRFSGYVFFSAGDSFAVAFHRVTDALSWSVDVHRAVASISDGENDSSLGLSVGIGLHTGEAEERQGRYFGASVHTAEALAEAGHGGQTLLSPSAAALVSEEDLQDLGTFQLSGSTREHKVFQSGSEMFPPLRIDRRTRGNLPRRLGRLIGRQDMLDLVDRAVADSPVVTLVGPGGIGKTSIALAAASRAAQNGKSVWLVELAGLTSPDDVARAVADVVKVNESSGLALMGSVVRALRVVDGLLVLDTCEHVVDGVAKLAEKLAAEADRLCVLATSREGLATSSERLLVVPPLDTTTSAVELFNERAAAASQAFDPAASEEAVEEICRRLDGVPLAIELAAARVRSLSAGDLVERLDNRLRLLTGGRRTSVERHRTLRATIQWSYDLLSAAEQELLQRLSIFAGPFDLAASSAIIQANDLGLIDIRDSLDVDDLLVSLADRSMLVVESGRSGRQFRMLETIQQFAAEYLVNNADPDAIARRHAEWCLGRVTEIGELLTGSQEREGVAQLGELWPNLRAGFDWACLADDMDLVFGLLRPIAMEIGLRGNREVLLWVERMLAMASPCHESEITLGLMWAAGGLMLRGEHDAYERLVEACGEPDNPIVAYARQFVYDDDEEMVKIYADASAEMRRLGEDHMADLQEISNAGSLMVTGRSEEGNQILSNLIERCQRSNKPTLHCWALITKGYLASFQGDLAEADKWFSRSGEQLLPEGTISINKPIEARTALGRGEVNKALNLLMEYVEEVLEAENWAVGVLACVEFVNMMAALGRLEEAARILGYLDTTGEFAAMSLEALVAEVVATIQTDPVYQKVFANAVAVSMNGADAMGYMRNVLLGLLTNPELPQG